MDQPMSNLGFWGMSVLFRIRDFLLPRRRLLNEAGISSGARVLDYGCPTAHPASLPTSLALIGSLILTPLRNRMSPPGVTSRSSVPCRPQTPWCGG